MRLVPHLLLGAGLACALAAPVAAEPFAWVDEQGVTHFTDDPAKVPAPMREEAVADVQRLGRLWDDGLLGVPTRSAPGESGGERDRVTRLLRGAIADLRRGETSRASAALNSAVRLDPSRAEPSWYLALLDRQRGRYERSTRELELFLEHAGPRLEPWRRSARRRLAELDDERRLADASELEGRLQLVASASPHFRIQVDSALDAGRTRYAQTVLRYLEEARAEVSRQLGVLPAEPLGVVFYGRARYDREHSHRFSFVTVGFFDGRIHVASPAHPSGGLRSLLFHEYTHALFREQTGGDRPYWLNEGLAERVERLSRKVPASTRSERSSMRTRIETGDWIPLRRLAHSFSGLDDDDARAAYLEGVLAAQYIERHTTREQRARLLAQLGEGHSIDQALFEALGVDTEGLDAAVQAEVVAEFPEIAASRSGTPDAER